MEDGRRAFKTLKFTPTGKRPLERPRKKKREGGNNRMDLRGIGINMRIELIRLRIWITEEPL